MLNLLLNSSLPTSRHQSISWANLSGSGQGLAICQAANSHDSLTVVVTSDISRTTTLFYESSFYASHNDPVPIYTLPTWETLPYDAFSPHDDITSQRLELLYRLPNLKKGILIVPLETLFYKLSPHEFVQAQTLMVEINDVLHINTFRSNLEHSGYRCVNNVYEKGEFAVRGSILDIYPMGSDTPFRLDLFDDQVDSIRTFEPESQRSLENISKIRLLPAKEFPLTEESIQYFRQSFRTKFPGDPQRCPIYSDISQGISPPGIEYYIPLFFKRMSTLFDYIPKSSLFFTDCDMNSASTNFFATAQSRFEQYSGDIERPILPLESLFLSQKQLSDHLTSFKRIELTQNSSPRNSIDFSQQAVYPEFDTPKNDQLQEYLHHLLADRTEKILFVTESTGRREALLSALRLKGYSAHEVKNWHEFLESNENLNIIVAKLDDGLSLPENNLLIITDKLLFRNKAVQQRKKTKSTQDNNLIIQNLTELSVGAAIVHEDHGVGRFIGLQHLQVDGVTMEFLAISYADDAKLYVPVSSLHLVSRYTGASPDAAPLHKLGSPQWQKAKKRAKEKVVDVAAELLDIYARRAAKKGFGFSFDESQYQQFSDSFPFEETEDQLSAINAVIGDMVNRKPMDRVVCGDVGFGKTEVAMRATFVAIQSNKQVSILVPTTLLAQQHYQNFQDRFASWPVNVAVLSRFLSTKEQNKVLSDIKSGQCDIVIGTHKLLQKDIEFKQLGLIVVDEEHRFGVRHKERLKSLRADVDILTLTATPIPRTLNMALAGMRDLSIIATPPTSRLTIKTFINTWHDAQLKEAISRELSRGGQIYFLHNEVKSIHKMKAQLNKLIPDLSIQVAHGQMSERELEQVMVDFYHQRFKVLLCTTIIESGIDVPTANTIIINRADKFGLSQLHQLRGRVGRSHHRAYAYLITPPKKIMTSDAVKRLDAIESMEGLGSGFTLATHDLEIRGAGELLGDEQSGQIQEVGFTLYSEMLERAVSALKSGDDPALLQPLNQHSEIDLRIPALISEDYLPDVHTRIVLYKRIANAKNKTELDDLQIEMIDRFGLLQESTKNLIAVTEIKLKAQQLGIKKIEAGPQNGRILFSDTPKIDADKLISLLQRKPQNFKLNGPEKLQFIFNMETTEERLTATNNTLLGITPD